ncbi:DUF4906 domain-containing protein [Bacteroides sp.]|uniref:DUF4906 domain-containing protein n=1 Tax=Bacteroides sp. TaxID=29523 RepID=UPI003AB4B5C5
MRFFKSSFATILLYILSVLFCASCIREDLAEQPESQSAIVRLEVRGERQAGVTTRVNETQISNLYILIYDGNGALIGQEYTATGSGIITVNTHSADNCTIYAIANAGDANLFSNSNIHSEANLKQMVRTISTWDELTTGTTLPMTGSLSKVKITAGTNTLGELKVSRMTAKITLSVDVAVGYRMSITGYRIYGIPKKAYYVLRPLGTETDQSDTQSTRAGDAALPANSSDWTNSGDLSPTSGTTIKTTFYMFENRPGINSSITQQKDKIKANAPGTPADSAAYVIIYGKAAGYPSISWKVYLGATNTGNFNIKRNSTYTYNITLRPNRSDTRITYEKDDHTIWAGSNIYWDGTKLTFDETVSNNSDLKQGVFFRWGSLIGIPASGSSTPSKFFVPKYNPDDPKSSTWEYKEYSYGSISCFVGEDLTGTDSRANTFLNDAARNTDASYLAYKGDICQYLSKTGAVSGDWRMPTSQEFSGSSANTGSWGSVSTNEYGTTIINSYVTFISGKIRFPASGYRNTSGVLSNTGQIGWCWSSSASAVNSVSYVLRFANSYVNTDYKETRHHGFPVRAVRN